jgi:cation diffusion facilitator CzcD-associated flavoprotein CzcO
VVVGAGISGIGAGYHLQKQCPNKSFVILEGRERFGGTWDLFRYPGIRSDSDMHTMGYRFKPWIDEKFIADGSSILNYLEETIDENNLGNKIRYQHKVLTSSWSSSTSKWTLEVKNLTSGLTENFTCNFLMMCGGYYNYDEGYSPHFENQEQFNGLIIHPQKWPDNLDYKNKKVVVIGSGATAVTIIPAMADQVEHITMLQRSPTYFISAPDKDMIGNFFKKIFSQKTAYFLTRWKNILMGNYFYKRCVNNPEKVKEMLINGVRAHLGEDYDIDTHFTPKYKPWDERLCFVPNADMFEAMKSGKASVVTDHIDQFTETGIKLKSGEELTADIIIKATGLNLQFLNGIDVKVDNSQVNISEKLAYKGRMFNDIPNLACSFGYARASWTLGADLSSEYVCKLLNYMDKHGYDYCSPVIGKEVREEGTYLNLSSGYVKRAIDRMPKQGSREPWKGNQSYLSDVTELRWGSITNDDLHFKTANQ